MKSLFLNTLLALSALLASASPVEVGKRDVWAPPVLYPHFHTVWTVGNHHNVTWSNANPSAQITNPIGTIYLAKGGKIVSGKGGLDHPLAVGFNLHTGRVEVKVPKVPSGEDYTVILVGDSGNASGEFLIQQ